MAAGFVEAGHVATVYCSGVAYVNTDGANLVFAVYQTRFCADGTAEKVIVCNVIIPKDAWIASRDMTNFAMLQSEKNTATLMLGNGHLS